MFSEVSSLGIAGIDGFTVEVQTDLSAGLPAFDIVGLPGQAVRESRDRVRAALKNCGFDFPLSRITVNLAPADVAKEGPLYDLPILASLLVATGVIPNLPRSCALIGELTLGGALRPVAGVLPMAIDAARVGIKDLFLPDGNASEASLAEGIRIIPLRDVAELVALLKGTATPRAVEKLSLEGFAADAPDFSEVKGQENVKRALEIAAAGGHNVLMCGAPGSGKSMLAKRLPGILPPMTKEEMLEVTKLYSVAGLLSREKPIMRVRPFRAPHHTASNIGLTGGGANPRPGELSLAHCGVLFLDELPEFSKSALEVLRQPLEDGRLTITRVRATCTFPCSFTLVAAMNPCRCGFAGVVGHKCSCSTAQLEAYRSRISGPLLDRFDIKVQVGALTAQQMERETPSESSVSVRARVTAARERQKERFADCRTFCNAQMERRQIAKFCPLSEEAAALLRDSYTRLSLSARGYDRVLKVSRTIADLAGSEQITPAHIAEALQYRGKS